MDEVRAALTISELDLPSSALTKKPFSVLEFNRDMRLWQKDRSRREVDWRTRLRMAIHLTLLRPEILYHLSS